MPSNFERKARRKHQTRLTFEPVDQSSSPANMSHTEVRVEIPSKRQRPTPVSSFVGAIDSESEDMLSSAVRNDFSDQDSGITKEIQKLPFKPLPTPAKSSQLPAKLDTSLGTLTFHSHMCARLSFTLMSWICGTKNVISNADGFL
jgi:hypothetical protein